MSDTLVKGMTVMADPKDYVFSEAASITDVDLDREKINLQGERLTEDRTERIAETALQETRRRGLIPWRKLLSGRYIPLTTARSPSCWGPEPREY